MRGRQIVALVVAGLCAVSAAACSTRPDPIEVIRTRFSGKAPQVFGERAKLAYERASDGFRPRIRSGVPADVAAQDGLDRGGVTLALPGDASEPLRFEFPDGTQIAVREQGASGAGRVEGGAVAYERDGAASVWSASPRGFEEWLYLAEAEAAHVIEWRLEGAAVLERPDGLYVADRRGRLRLRVAAPEAWDLAGNAVPLRLTGAGDRLRLRVDSQGTVLVDPSWTAVVDPSDPFAPRFFHTATWLPSTQQVVVIGGANQGVPASSVLVFTPASGWAVQQALQNQAMYQRWKHTATLLPDERILVFGGHDGTVPLSTGITWPTGENFALQDPRYLHTATPIGTWGALPPWNVLIAGGQIAANTNEIGVTVLQYTTRGTWSDNVLSTPISWPRRLHTATALSTTEILFAGGCRRPESTTVTPGTPNWPELCEPTNLAEVFVYDPANPRRAASSFQTDSATSVRAAHTATPLEALSVPPGVSMTVRVPTVMVLGGFDASNQALATAEVFDPQGGSVDANGRPRGRWLDARLPGLKPRARHTATMMTDRRIVLLGGFGGAADSLVALADAQVINPMLGTVIDLPLTPAMPARAHHTATEILKPDEAGVLRPFLLVTGGTADAAALRTAVAAPFSGIIDLDSTTMGAAAGARCTAAADCASGLCVDSICCAQACGACETCAAVTGACTPRPSTFECRPSAGVCDVPEFCNGARDCPPDGFDTTQKICRASARPCDKAEVCSGSEAACPLDSLEVEGTVCAAAAGDCDAPDLCSAEGVCVPTLAAPGTPCRGSAGPCDKAEVCSGSSPTCPADGFAAQGIECRAAQGPCDAPEVCSGSGALCPDDALKAEGAECRAAVYACDLAELCSGTEVACPPDVFKPASSVCRAAVSVCDLPETCAGDGTDCPPDAFVAADPVRLCRESAGECDPAETCSGQGPACPADSTAADGTTCSEGECEAGVCRVPEDSVVVRLEAPKTIVRGATAEVGVFVSTTHATPLRNLDVVVSAENLDLRSGEFGVLRDGARHIALAELMSGAEVRLGAVRVYAASGEQTDALVRAQAENQGRSVSGDPYKAPITIEPQTVRLGGCGCQATSGAAPWLVLAATAALARRARPRAFPRR